MSAESLASVTADSASAAVALFLLVSCPSTPSLIAPPISGPAAVDCSMVLVVVVYVANPSARSVRLRFEINGVRVY